MKIWPSILRRAAINQSVNLENDGPYASWLLVLSIERTTAMVLALRSRPKTMVINTAFWFTAK